MFLVYLNSRYGAAKITMSKIKNTLNYESIGAVHDIVNNSGFFMQEGDEIRLSEEGMEYVKSRILPYFSAFNPISYLLVILGALVLLHWYLRVYVNTLIVFDWYAGLALVLGGVVLRFLFYRILFWTMKFRKTL